MWRRKIAAGKEEVERDVREGEGRSCRRRTVSGEGVVNVVRWRYCSARGWC